MDVASVVQSDALGRGDEGADLADGVPHPGIEGADIS
jgi:hypothetical protein